MLREQTRYSRLANITKIINTRLELRKVLQHVTTAISEEIVQCDAVGVYLPLEDGTYRGFAGKPEVISGVTINTQIIDPKVDLLAREVIETKQPIYIPDTSKDQRPDPRVVNAFKIKSLLVLPISYEEEFFGLVFLFDYGVPMNLTESEIQSVEAYVNMAAVAIQNANSLRQKEDHIAEKQLLLDVTRDLSMCLSLQQSLEKCFFYLGKILHCEKMAVHFLDAIDKKTIQSTRVNKSSQWSEEICNNTSNNISVNYQALINQVVETKKIIHIPNVQADERFNQKVCKDLAIEGLLLIPLISVGDVLGVVVIVSSAAKDQKELPPSKIQLVQSIVDATAPTFSNLLYMDQLEHVVEERTKELAAANQRVTSVIESITDGFFALNEEWKFSYINKHQHLPKNKTIEELLGKNIWEVYPETIPSPMYTELHRAMIERIPVQFEINSIYDDSWHEVVAYPFDDGICCLFKNITGKKKYEKELKRLSSLDLIGQMAAGISHEIRNPMTTVRGFLQLLKKDQEFEKHHLYFNLMIEELDRANSIITEFLSMGNTRTSDLQMLDLNSIIHDITPLIKIDASSQNKFIHVDTNDVPELLLNRNEIRQLLINLYRNGLDAMGPGKVLTIRTYKDGSNCIVLAVEDQGSGIKPEILEKLGTPFFTTKANGTGLGLGVCYAIAARHNAIIDIETSSEGTTFYTKFYY